MNNTQCCVIDADNYYVDLFSVYEDSEKVLHVYGYTMQPGDRMLDVSQPLKRLHAGGAGFVKPRWDEDTAAWVEGATAEELAAWEEAHPAPAVDLDMLRAAKQEQNKQALADWLAAHPLTWTDGNVYGVTEEDQNEMAINLAQYQLAVAAEQPAVLEWHAQKKQCHAFTIEQYTALSLAIAAYVYPYRRYQEQVKAAIYTAESEAEIHAIKIDYGSVGAAA